MSEMAMDLASSLHAKQGSNWIGLECMESQSIYAFELAQWKWPRVETAAAEAQKT
jgi:hypothetical protein